MISDANYRMLVWIRRQNVDGITVTDDAILDSEHHYMRTQKLCDAGLLARAVLVNPGMEKEYPDGLYHYYVTVDGFDAIALYEQKLDNEKKQRAEKDMEKLEADAKEQENSRKKSRHDYLVAIFSQAVGILLGILVEHFFEVYETIESVLGK